MSMNFPPISCTCSKCGHTWVLRTGTAECPDCKDWRKPIVRRLVEEALNEGLSLKDLTELYNAYLNEEVP